MAFWDMREFVEALDEHGELCRIKEEVDWNLEFGAIARRCCEIGAPAPFAEKVKGYPGGYRLFGVPFGGSIVDGKKMPYRRLAIGLGLDPDIHHNDLVEEYVKRKNNPIRPVVVSGGPSKENIRVGKDVNLFEFPAPMVHWGDGGRYLCTWHMVITQDPDTGWVNWGMYRAMIHTKNKMGGMMIPIQHGPQMYYNKYEARGNSMPFAIAIGCEPAQIFAATAFLPAGVREADLAGGLRGSPVELVKCETNDLYVPATAEIVLEGEVRPYERWDEGPFGEYTGYRASPRMARPVYRVNCITFRDNPIVSMSCMGMPVDDSGSQQSILIAGELMDIFRTKGYPVRMVYQPPFATNATIVISTKVPYANFAHVLASEAWAAKAGSMLHYVIVVEDDVDPTDMEQVMHAITFKCHPYRGIRKYEAVPGTPLDPYLNYHERQFGLGAGVLLDCTWPKDWDPEISLTLAVTFETLYPKPIQEKVLANWSSVYGFAEKRKRRQ